MPKITPLPTDGVVSDELAELLIHQHRAQIRPGLERLWSYFRNDMTDVGPRGRSGRRYHLAQEQGLPSRLTQPPAFGEDAANHREIVVDNEIAWRIGVLVDFMFGRSVTIQSQADDPQIAALIERVLSHIIDCNGGVSFFQDAALLGSVYGYVDLLVRLDQLPTLNRTSASGSGPGDGTPARAPLNSLNPERALTFASDIVIEAVEAPRAVPVLDQNDYRRLTAYLLDYTLGRNEVDRSPLISRLIDRDGQPARRQATMQVNERWSAQSIAIYHDGRRVHQMTNPLGRLPVVHIQNLAQPFFYEGLSEVEPLIPLQDELNTRLSDRANRITMQSFKMYLGKGLENFLERPVGPGQMWMTDNPDAEVQAFGGDGPNPSEDAHIEQIRQAMDKVSSVTAVAAGLLRNRVGNLSSENALRIVMMGLLARTEKKRVTYGQGIARLCELLLEVLDVAGVLPTKPAQRRVQLHWPSPIPENTTQRLREAEIKLRLGVPQAQVLAELGYERQAVETASKSD